MDYEKIQEYGWFNPKSICACGHTGDGGNSQHLDGLQRGHGRCKVDGCNCAQFTWVGWTEHAEKMLSLK